MSVARRLLSAGKVTCFAVGRVLVVVVLVWLVSVVAGSVGLVVGGLAMLRLAMINVFWYFSMFFVGW